MDRAELIKGSRSPDRFTCPLATLDFREGGPALVCMKAAAPMAPVTVGMPADFPRDIRTDVSLRALDPTRTEMTVTEQAFQRGYLT